MQQCDVGQRLLGSGQSANPQKTCFRSPCSEVLKLAPLPQTGEWSQTPPEDGASRVPGLRAGVRGTGEKIRAWFPDSHDFQDSFSQGCYLLSDRTGPADSCHNHCDVIGKIFRAGSTLPGVRQDRLSNSPGIAIGQLLDESHKLIPITIPPQPMLFGQHNRL